MVLRRSIMPIPAACSNTPPPSSNLPCWFHRYTSSTRSFWPSARFSTISARLPNSRLNRRPKRPWKGGLLGHIVLGHAFFLKLKDKIEGFPEELSVKIQHLIVSHHGEKEFGSPEVPKTAEAYVLHLMDMLDSRMNIFSELVRTADSGRLFSEFSTSLGSRILVDKK